MDENTLPSDLADRPRSQEGGVPVPFACEDEDGGFDIREVSKRRAIRCALSRICGLCGISLGWPVAFLGSQEEANRNALHFPPLHEACAEAALSLYPAPAESSASTTASGTDRRPRHRCRCTARARSRTSRPSRA